MNQTGYMFALQNKDGDGVPPMMAKPDGTML